MIRAAVAVHAGATSRVDDADELREACAAAADAGCRVLDGGGSPLDAVEAAVRLLEDDARLNAGTGAALTATGDIELDASVMEGTSRQAGGVAALGPVDHPVSVARAVLERGRHVLYAGPGADRFARAAGFAPVDASALMTERSRALLHAWLERHEPPPVLDTVGAVAVDGAGRTAAATSTGGLVGQEPGRVGDSPIPGAGSYADDRRGAVSTTGEGEAILRAVLAFDAVGRLAGTEPQAAADAAVARLGDDYGGRGGLILIDARGRVAAAYNTPSMPWAAAWVDGERSNSHAVDDRV